MAEKKCRCDSRDAYAWLATTFGDKGQTLQRQIDALRKTIDENNLPLELFLISPLPVFTSEVAARINEAVIREASLLDMQLRRCPRGSAPATRESMTLMKEMSLALLKEYCNVDAEGHHISEAQACKMLGWRRPEHHYFRCVREVTRFYGPINHGECFGSEANRLITDAYERIKNEI